MAHFTNPSRDSFEVIVAAWGPAFGYPDLHVFDGEQFADQGPDVPYEQRAKVSVQASDGTTLGEVIDRAAEHFDVHIEPDDIPMSRRVPCIAFFRPSDGSSGTTEQIGAIRTVDPEGGPSWAVRWSEIRLDELVATSEAGLLEGGEPLRPYFWPVIPQGLFGDLAGSLTWMWMYWEQVLAALETVSLVRTLIERIKAGQSVAREGSRWSDALRRPQDLMPYLDRDARTTAEVASYTGFSDKEVKGALWAMGYALGEDGRWRPGADRAAAVLQAGLLDIKRLGRGPLDLEEAAARVRELVEASERE